MTGESRSERGTEGSEHREGFLEVGFPDYGTVVVSPQARRRWGCGGEDRRDGAAAGQFSTVLDSLGQYWTVLYRGTREARHGTSL